MASPSSRRGGRQSWLVAGGVAAALIGGAVVLLPRVAPRSDVGPRWVEVDLGATPTVDGARSGIGLPTPSASASPLADAQGQAAAPTTSPTQGSVQDEAGQTAAETTPIGEVIDDPLLRAQVQAVAEAAPGVVGVAIKNLSTGRGVLLNAEEDYPAASLFKVPVMYEIFKLRQAGSLSFDEWLVVTPGFAAYDLGTLSWPVGSRVTVGTALERMITVSDNTSAVMLLSRVGAQRLNSDMAALGLRNTYISDPRLTTSPRDMLLLLEAIARGEAIDAAASAEMAHLLLRQQINDRLPAGLPPGTPVAHKTGNWGGAVHDVGIVFAPQTTYVIAVMTRDLRDAGAGAAAIAELARLTHQHFDAAPGANPYPLPDGEFSSYASPPMLAAPAPARSNVAPPPVAEEPPQAEPVPTKAPLPPRRPMPTPAEASPPSERSTNVAEPTTVVPADPAPAAVPTSAPAEPTQAPQPAAESAADSTQPTAAPAQPPQSQVEPEPRPTPKKSRKKSDDNDNDD